MSSPQYSSCPGLNGGRWLACTLLALFLTATTHSPAATDDPLGVLRADSAVDVRTLLLRAEEGDSRASFLLGTRYASGRAGVQDDSEAVRWFRKAAAAGLAEAQYNLGVMYASGRGVARDMSEAAHWYEEAAKQGIGEAQYNLGTLYGVGLGVAKDQALAADWLRRAADKGLPEAEFNLGVLYEHGHGVRLDGNAAMEWYKKAAKKGYEPAAQRLDALRAKMLSGDLASLSEEYIDSVDPSVVVPAAEVAVPAAEVAVPVAEVAVPVAEVAVPVAEVAAARLADPTPGAARSNQWVQSLNPKHYTLQLISHVEEERAIDFIRARSIGQQAGYFTFQLSDSNRYSVIYGVYLSYEDAQAAARVLPPALDDLQPWVRNLGIIQKLLTP